MKNVKNNPKLTLLIFRFRNLPTLALIYAIFPLEFQNLLIVLKRLIKIITNKARRHRQSNRQNCVRTFNAHDLLS
jgi:hypothetical protein